MKRIALPMLVIAMLFAVLSVAPTARATFSAQDDGNMTFRGSVELQSFGQSAPPTDEERLSAQPAPMPEPVAGGGSQIGLTADGPAMRVPGNMPGVANAAAGAGAVGFTNSSTPNLTYPFPFDRAGVATVYYRTYPWATNGKLYFHNDVYGWTGSLWGVCSGTSVSSGSGGNESQILTAGHCLHAGNNSGLGWSYDLYFYPAERLLVGPYGYFYGFDWGVKNSWYTSANLREDFGFVTANLGGVAPCLGVTLSDCVGTQGLAWNQAIFNEFWTFGYPVEPPYDGTKMLMCTGSTARLDPVVGTGALPLAMGCDMTGGSSGGGWFVADRMSNYGYAESVTSYKYIAPSQPNAIYGPYFASSFQSLYDVMRTEVVP